MSNMHYEHVATPKTWHALRRRPITREDEHRALLALAQQLPGLREVDFEVNGWWWERRRDNTWTQKEAGVNEYRSPHFRHPPSASVLLMGMMTMSLNVVNDKDFGDVIRTFLQQILEQMEQLRQRDRYEEAISVGAKLHCSLIATPQVAQSLHRTGLSLTALDRHEDAVAAYTEAATIWQNMCGVRPHLAWSFHNMGLSLAELGRHEAAGGLSQHSGRHEAAVKVYKESAKIRQELTKTDPTVLPQLAGSFHNTGPSLAELGHHEAAVEAYKKAAKIRQELAKTDPTVLPQLAWSFHNTGPSLAELGRHEAADLAETDHTALPELAVTFHKMGLSLAELGRQEDAVAVYKKATTFPQELAEDPAVLRLLSVTPIFPEVPTPDLESAPLLPLLLVKMGKVMCPQRWKKMSAKMFPPRIFRWSLIHPNVVVERRRNG
ncbi:hypothetical protein B0H14DRAFT_3503918 [Mycena olivaceomarginata]|nr:hypothetical protein B0H14DRAFT_3503918 [Mycena olivaceomarginata]